MKRTHFLILAIITMAIGLFSSCSLMEDADKAKVLSGEWKGDFGMYYYYADRSGHTEKFESHYTRICFIPNYENSRSGTGIQVDYYDEGPYEYQYYQFSWSVSDGAIYLTYDYDHELDTRISDYHLKNDYFRGTFSSSGIPFTLYKITDYYDWTPYVDAYGSHSRNNWSRSNSPATRTDDEELSDSTATAVEGHIISRGRRTTPLQQ